MGYFNPVSYFIKSFIRIFTKKFFWVILISVCLFLGFIIFNNNGVFAVSSISFNEAYITSSDISAARTKVGETIWNDDSYDIFIHFNAGTGTKCVTYFQPSLEYYNVYYTLTSGNVINNYPSFMLRFVSGGTGSPVSNGTVICKSLSNSWSETLNGGSSDTGRWIYTFYAPSNDSNNILCKPIRTHFDIKDVSGNIVFSATNPVVVNPYFVTTDTELQTFDFDYLQISGGNSPYYTEIPNISDVLGGNADLSLVYLYNGVSTNIDLSNYIVVNSDNTWSVNIPYNVLTNSVIVRDRKEFSYIFTYTPFYGSQYIVSKLNLIYDLTPEQEENINQDSEKQVQGEILQQQQETNNKLDNIDNTITDSTIDDITSDSLPSDDTVDITSDGVNGIFTSIYNAFCTGDAQDIVFPIPFTNKNITLHANYVSSMLTSSGATWVITIIQAFWWYIISRFIIKDIMNKINKIKSGNIEQIETTNIRGDML